MNSPIDFKCLSNHFNAVLSSGGFTINTVHLFSYKRPTAQTNVKIFGKRNGAVKSVLVMVQRTAKAQ